MNFIKIIIEKLKLKELFAMLFIAGLIITFLPNNIAVKIKISTFREIYQVYISLALITIGSYYILKIGSFIAYSILNRIFNNKKIAIKYMKNTLTPDEMGLLIEKFYDDNNKRFKSIGYIELSDGRKIALENKHIIYRSSELSYDFSFAYNLQPYALEFLNRNIKEGNINIIENHFEYKLI